MSGYVTLLGAEEVSRAASRMSEAASQMQSAAGSISYALENHQRFMDQWLTDLRILLEEHKPKPKEGG